MSALLDLVRRHRAELAAQADLPSLTDEDVLHSGEPFAAEEVDHGGKRMLAYVDFAEPSGMKIASLAV